jgi:endonuclease YncB( thermonuclease family)
MRKSTGTTDVRTALALLLILVHFIASAGSLTGRVVRVTDGDTIVVLDSNNAQHKIRLTGIDAPERKQAFGTKSKEHLSESVAGKFVVVEYSKRDYYKRILGKVLLSGEDMNLEQLRAGLAWHYKKYQNEQSLRDRKQYTNVEIEAREELRGLWNDPQPIPPWDYRHGQRSRTMPLVSQPVKSAFTCGTKRFCREMTSCKEAIFYLNQCGLSRLDGDGDGVPCESICRRR